MKSHLFTAVTFGMSLLPMAGAFEPPVPSSAIFNFDNEKRPTLESYNKKHLKGHGIYKNIPLKKEDASFGDELTLKGFDVLTGYKTACGAFIPKVPKRPAVAQVRRRAGIHQVSEKKAVLSSPCSAMTQRSALRFVIQTRQ